MNKQQLHEALFTINGLALQTALEPLLLQVEQEKISFSDALDFVSKNTSLEPKKFLDFSIALSKCLSNWQIVQETGETEEQLTTPPINQSTQPKPLQPTTQTPTTFDDLINSFPHDTRKAVRSIALSYVKSVRNDLDTFDALTREVAKGGAALTYADAQSLVQALEEFKSEYNSTQTLVAPKKDAVVQDLSIDHDKESHTPHRFVELPDTHPEIKDVMEHIRYHKKQIETPLELTTPPTQPLLSTVHEDHVVPKEINELIEKEKLTTPSIKPSTPLTRANLRPLMQEVVAQQLDTPVTELGRLTVTDFRRLDKDPKTATARIIQKLEVLSLDSLLKKEEGIQSLFTSPLYKAYTDILTKSMLEGKPFEEVIAKKANLTLEEFSALMELNGQLRYKV